MYNAWEPGQYSPDSESEAQGQGGGYCKP